ncbi:MAG: hypothetical protein WD708_01090, partial [Kiritimatiellia bacterium]
CVWNADLAGGTQDRSGGSVLVCVGRVAASYIHENVDSEKNFPTVQLRFRVFQENRVGVVGAFVGVFDRQYSPCFTLIQTQPDKRKTLVKC